VLKRNKLFRFGIGVAIGALLSLSGVVLADIRVSSGGTIIIGNSGISGGSDGDILYRNGSVLGGFQLYSGSGAGDGAFALRKTMSGSSATSNFFSVTGTFPGTLSAETNGVLFSFTGDNDNQLQHAVKISLSGTGGTQANRGLYVVNTMTNSTITSEGVFVDLSGNTTSSVGYTARLPTASSGFNYGLMSFVPIGASAQIGVGGILTAYALPTNARAAGYFDNGTNAVDIISARDNGTAVFTIADGGYARALDGAASTPSYSFINATGTGIYNAAGNLRVAIGTSTELEFRPTGPVVDRTAGDGYTWSSGIGVPDTFITSSGAAVINLGAADAASPVNQSYRAQGSRGGTDTNTAGGSLTGYAGLGTGNAAVSEYIFQTGVVQASGTTQHTTTNAAKITAGGLQNTKGDSIVTTTDVTNATTTFAAITGLTSTVVNARKYRFEMDVWASESQAAEGAKLDFNGGSATMTSFIASCHLINAVGATLTQTNATTVALATSINIAAFTDTNMHRYHCTGAFVPSAAGTFIPRQAQNSHTSGTLTVKVGSYLSIWDMP